MDCDEILTTRDVSRILDRSCDCVRLYERTGKLPARKTQSGQRLFNKSDVVRLAKKLAERR
jgi:DNA-binding transcriptional MerR regulator